MVFEKIKVELKIAIFIALLQYYFGRFLMINWKRVFKFTWKLC
jgi:hypothetical protein